VAQCWRESSAYPTVPSVSGALLIEATVVVDGYGYIAGPKLPTVKMRLDNPVTGQPAAASLMPGDGEEREARATAQSPVRQCTQRSPAPIARTGRGCEEPRVRGEAVRALGREGFLQDSREAPGKVGGQSILSGRGLPV
jgi:hypothetical protein